MKDAVWHFDLLQLFGNLYGMLTIHTAPLTAQGENFSVKAVRADQWLTL